MGQKSNPFSLKSNSKNTTWSSKYIEKINSDASLLITQDFNIRNFLNRFFSMHGLILCNYNLYRTQQNLNLFISYFSTEISFKLFKKKKKKKKNFKLEKKCSNFWVLKIAGKAYTSILVLLFRSEEDLVLLVMPICSYL